MVTEEAVVEVDTDTKAMVTEEEDTVMENKFIKVLSLIYVFTNPLKLVV